MSDIDTRLESIETGLGIVLDILARMEERDAERNKPRVKRDYGDKARAALDRIGMEYMLELRALIKRHHEHTAWLQDAHDGIAKEALVIDQLVRMDNYTKAEIMACLEWVFAGECKDAVFWREQVRSIQGLRVKKGGATKFAKIWLRYKANTAPRKEAPANARMDTIFESLEQAQA